MAIIPIIVPCKQTFATASGSVVREVTCENCGHEYVYLLERTESPTELHSLFDNTKKALQETRKRAKRLLEYALANDTDLVSCPKCGWYQADMVSIMRRSRLEHYVGLGFASLTVCFFLYILLLCLFPYERQWLALFITLLVFVSVLYACIFYYWRFNPNQVSPSDREQRREESRGLSRTEFEEIVRQQAQTESEEVP